MDKSCNNKKIQNKIYKRYGRLTVQVEDNGKSSVSEKTKVSQANQTKTSTSTSKPIVCYLDNSQVIDAKPIVGRNFLSF